MRRLIFLWLLFAVFTSQGQTPIVELLSKADSTKKAYTTPPAGYGSLYYNYHKAEWWKVENGVRTKAFNAGGGGGGTVTGSGTSNQIAYWSTASAIGALNTTTYPSLTELSYVKGVTSAIQTQLGTKHSGSVTTGYIPKATGSLTLGNSILSESGLNLSLAGNSLAVSAPTTTNSYISFTNASSGFGLGVLGWDVASNTLISNNLAGSFTLAAAGARPLQIGTNNLPRITVLSGGNVGIGTNTPSQLLDVTSATTTAAINVSSASTANSYSSYTNSAAGYGVGIVGWDIAGNSLIGSTLPGSFVMATGSARPLQIATNNTPRMTILSSGEVGIGTATPAYNLHVVGSILSTALTSTRVLTAGASGLIQDDADLTFTGGNTLNAANATIATALKNTALTSGRLPYITTGGQFTDEAALTYEASTNSILLANAANTATTSIYGAEIQFDDIANSDDLTINNAGIVSTGNASMALSNAGGAVVVTSSTGALGMETRTGSLKDSSYEPTEANVTGSVSAVASAATNYTRVGKLVIVSGEVGLDSSGTNECVFSLTLPVSSNLSTSGDVAGGGTLRHDVAGVITMYPVFIKSNPTTNVAELSYVAGVAIADGVISYSYQYIIQ